MKELTLMETPRPELPALITDAGQGAALRFLELALDSVSVHT